MESSKTKKKIVLMAVSLATGGLIISSLLGVLELAKSPPPVTASLSSQNAQVAAQENGFLTVLKQEPKNSTAITGMEGVIKYYLQTNNQQKSIESLEKLIAAAPQAARAKEYAQVLAEMKKAPAPGNKEK